MGAFILNLNSGFLCTGLHHITTVRTLIFGDKEIEAVYRDSQNTPEIPSAPLANFAFYVFLGLFSFVLGL